jgi:hypothetical protein
MNSKTPKPRLFTLVATCLLVFIGTSNAAVITFDEVIHGEISYAYDGDGDEIDDVIFSTDDPDGFRTVGPGTNMNFIAEPGIEGTTVLGVDLKVEFIWGATSNITFGFAMLTTQEIYGVTFEIYDHTDALLASTFQVATYTDITYDSSFPEALLSLDFEGTAAYGLFKFDAVPTRYIIDNFKGAFGSRPDEQDAVITDFETAPEGFIIEWTPLVGLDSVVKWSSNLAYVPFTSTSMILPYPQNSYTDTVHSAESKCFYRIDLVHPE